uniref:Uncharacterized protein n=1 Tax=Rhizophora mucronata TaxID=61149 RepID=A0A2P2QH38_RHIMU
MCTHTHTNKCRVQKNLFSIYFPKCLSGKVYSPKSRISQCNEDTQFLMLMWLHVRTLLDFIPL